MSNTKTEKWTVDLFLTPQEEDDPLGVYRIREVSERLTEQYFQADCEDEKLEAVHNENRAIAEKIARLPELLSLAQAIADDPYSLSPDQWASEARQALGLVTSALPPTR